MPPVTPSNRETGVSKRGMLGHADAAEVQSEGSASRFCLRVVVSVLWSEGYAVVRFQLGILSCLLAGCVTQPTAPDPRLALGLPKAAEARTPAGMMLRIGVEYLPPETNQDVEEPIADVSYTFDEAPPPQKQEPERSRTNLRRRAEDPPHPWAMTISDLNAIDDPVAREALHFVDDLMREDQRRVRREVRMPFFEWQPTDLEGGPKLWSEQRTIESQEEWIHEHGPGLLQKPLRQLLRRLPIAREVEVGLQDFRSDHVPFSEPYRLAHGDQRRLGRMSVRLRTGDLSDPVEIAYMKSGVRISTSQTAGKLSIDWPFAERWELQLRTRTDYDTHEHHVRADLVFWPNPSTSIHLSAGNDLDFLSTSSIYSLFESPMDGSPGLLLYAVHTF